MYALVRMHNKSRDDSLVKFEELCLKDLTDGAHKTEFHYDIIEGERNGGTC